MNIWAGFVKTNSTKTWTFVGAWRNHRIAQQETQKAAPIVGKAMIRLYAPKETKA